MENIKNQITTNSEIELFICPICEEPFNSELAWIKHMKTHIPTTNNDSELKEIYNILNKNFLDCQIRIANGIKDHCKYNIVLTTKNNLKINLKYKFMSVQQESPIYPNNINELMNDISYILETIDAIETNINEQGKLYDFKCTEYCSYVDILENKFLFQFKLNPDDSDENHITEVFCPYEENKDTFINRLNEYTMTEVQGNADIGEEGWGDVFYINNINIKKLISRAMNEGKQVSLKII